MSVDVCKSYLNFPNCFDIWYARDARKLKIVYEIDVQTHIMSLELFDVSKFNM